MTLVVRTDDGLQVTVERVDAAVEMHTLCGPLSAFQRFTASQAMELGVALQRDAEAILQAG